MNFRGLHILSVDQFDRTGIDELFHWTDEALPYAQRTKVTRVLEGAILANLFFEPSTRSRLSFGAAFNRLGGYVRETTGFQFSSMAKGESVHDTSRVISGYVDIVVVRHPKEGSVRQFAAATNIPVINGGDGAGEHPTQALLDLYTLTKELGRSTDDLSGVRVAMVGDLKYGRTVHSLTKLLSLLPKVELTFVSPVGLQMPDRIVALARARGHEIRVTDKLWDVVSDVDVIYSTRIQEERFASIEDFAQYRGCYSITRETYERYCRKGTVLMHPLPRDSRPESNELDDDLNGHPSLAIFRQTDNGIPIRMALFALVLGVTDQLHATGRLAPWYSPTIVDRENHDPHHDLAPVPEVSVEHWGAR